MYSCQCIGPCHLAKKKWDSTEARVNTITIKSDTYCAFECDYHPHFCTHWARSRNKCILYFGDIHEPSPDIVQNWPVSDNREVGIGTRLCRIGIGLIVTNSNQELLLFYIKWNLKGFSIYVPFIKDYDDVQSTWGDWRMCENGVDCKERPVSVSCTSGRSIRFRNCSQGSLILDGQCRGEYLYCSDPMSKCCRKFISRNIWGAMDIKCYG